MSIRHGAPMGLAILAMSACATTPPETAPPNTSPPGDRGILQSNEAFVRAYHVTPGCYASGDQQFRFKVYTDVPDDPAHWNLVARAVTRACTDTAMMPRRTEFYSIGNPTANKTVMILWKNVTSNYYGYVVVRYDPVQQTGVAVTNGGRTHLVFSKPVLWWNSGGQAVMIAVQYGDLASPETLRNFPLLFKFKVSPP